MSGSKRRRSFERIRIIILTFLVAVIAAEWTLLQPGEIRPSEGVTASVDRIAVKPLVNAAPTPEAYMAVVTSDLFTQERQAPPAALSRFAARATTSTQGASDIDVLGIIIAGQDRIAIIQSAGSAQPLRVRIGEALGGATVRDISPTYVVLQTNGIDRVVAVRHQGPSPMADQMIATAGTPPRTDGSPIESPPAAEPDPAPPGGDAANQRIELEIPARPPEVSAPDGAPSNPATGK